MDKLDGSIPLPPIPQEKIGSGAALGEIFNDDVARVNRLAGVAMFNLERHKDDPDSFKIYDARLKTLRREKEMMRLPSEDDLSYRNQLKTTFPMLVESCLGKGSPLRFHGTPIIFLQDILRSGIISSAVDHSGIRMSYDVSGQISVTSPENIGVTINDYIGVKSKSLPLGCVFVLLPKSAEEAEASCLSMAMENAKLKGSGENAASQLHRVLCSPETLPVVQNWLREYNYDPGLAVEYFDFLGQDGVLG